MTTWYRQGKTEGANETSQRWALRILSARFQLNDFIQEKIKQMESTQLERLAKDMLDPTKTLKDLGLAN